MFKNLTVYRLANGFHTEAEVIEEALGKHVFHPCAPTEPMSAGWVPPRGVEHGALVEVIDGHLHMKLQTETRVLPGSVVKDRVDEICLQVEQQTGRKPGKKAIKDIKEQAIQELLPKCFTKRNSVRLWIAPEEGLLMVDATSAARSEEVVTLLIKTLDGLALHLIQTAEAPAACMAAWLMDGDAPEGFTIDRDAELKSEDEMRSSVRYGRHALDIDEVRQHLTSGKRPTKLAMTFKERVSFVLTDALLIKKISFLDLAFEGREVASADEQFDADAAIATGELIAMIPALIDGLGGEHQFLGGGHQDEEQQQDEVPEAA